MRETTYQKLCRALALRYVDDLVHEYFDITNWKLHTPNGYRLVTNEFDIYKSSVGNVVLEFYSTNITVVYQRW